MAVLDPIKVVISNFPEEVWESLLHTLPIHTLTIRRAALLTLNLWIMKCAVNLKHKQVWVLFAKSSPSCFRSCIGKQSLWLPPAAILCVPSIAS